MLSLPAHVGQWLLRMGLVEPSELEAQEPFLLKRGTAQEFENGVRVARLLQLLSVDGAETLETLKDVNTPVAKLYNWNLLLPVLRLRGLDVDQDMKVLIVAGDNDIVADLLGQLHAKDGGKGPQNRSVAGGRARGAAEDSVVTRPATIAASTSVVQFLACCCEEQLGCSWDDALNLVRNPKKLHDEQIHGVEGSFAPVVRWFKLVFAHCKLLSSICDSAHVELVLNALSGGLSSMHAEVALWSSRVLCRLAAELAGRGLGLSMWQWFSGAANGCASVLSVWASHPELHATGALMPLALHMCGEKLHLFLSTVLPRELSAHASYLSFVLELLPYLSSSSGSADFMLRSGALTKLLQRALRVARAASEPPPTRGLALELLAALWSNFTREVESVTLEPAEADSIPPSKLETVELQEQVDEEKADPRDASTQILAELKRGCRDANLELQLTAHMSLFLLLDDFAAASHPSAPYIFNLLSFSLIENHHEPVLRQFLARNMQHSLQHQPFIPVGVLLKPLVKQATLYGYSNLDFDFFLTLAKHQRLGLRHGLLLLQFLGKVCLNDALHGRVATIPFLVLVERFHDAELLHDFLEIFCEQALASLLPETAATKSNAGSAIRATLCIELVAKILHLPHAHVIQRVRPAVHSIATQYASLTGTEHPGLNALLTFAAKGGTTDPHAPAPDGPASHGPVHAKPNASNAASPPASRLPPKRRQPGSNAGPELTSDSPTRAVEPKSSKAPTSDASPTDQPAKKAPNGYAVKPSGKTAAAARPKPAAPAPSPKAVESDGPTSSRPAKRSHVEALPAVVPLSADEKELKAQEDALSEQIKALDEKLDAAGHEKPPAGLSPLLRREHEIEIVKAVREAKLERSRLEEERRKLRSVRIKRRMRAKYEAKLKAARAGGDESGSFKAGTAAEESVPAPPPKRTVRKVKREEPAEPELSEVELRRQKGEQKRRQEAEQKKKEEAKRLSPAAIAKLEKQLQEAEDPSTVPIPAGYKVLVEGDEKAALPPSGESGDSHAAAIEALDRLCFAAVGVHVVQKPVLRVVPSNATHAPKQALKKPVKEPTRQPSPPKVPPSPTQSRQPRSPLPPRQPRAPSTTRQPRSLSPDGRPTEKAVSQTATTRKAKSRSPERVKPSSSADAMAKDDSQGSFQKNSAAVPPLVVKRRPQGLPEPPPSSNPMRVDVQKYQQEVARLKEEDERNKKLQARRAEAKAKLEAWQAEKAAKEAEKQRVVEESELTKLAEAEKKREKDRKRQAQLKKKLDEYHKEQQKPTDSFGNSGNISEVPDSPHEAPQVKQSSAQARPRNPDTPADAEPESSPSLKNDSNATGRGTATSAAKASAASKRDDALPSEDTQPAGEDVADDADATLADAENADAAPASDEADNNSKRENDASERNE